MNNVKSKIGLRIGQFSLAMGAITLFINKLLTTYNTFQNLYLYIVQAKNFVLRKKTYTLAIPYTDEALNIILTELTSSKTDNLSSNLTMRTSQKMMNKSQLTSEERINSVLETSFFYSGTDKIKFVLGKYTFAAELKTQPNMNIGSKDDTSSDRSSLEAIISRRTGAQKKNKTEDGLIISYSDKKAFDTLRDWIGDLLSTAKPVESMVFIPEWDSWMRSESGVIKRKLEHVFLPGTVKEDLVADISSFFASEDVYDHIGKPFHRGYLFTGIPGSGKRLSINTPILTPTGWVSNGDLITGQEVIGSDGKSTKISYAHRIETGPAYFITFTDKTTIIADPEHLWQVQTYKQRSKNSLNSILLTTQQMVDYGVRRNRNGNRKPGYSFYLPLVEPVEMVKKTLPIDPYLLGTFLANGSFTSTIISFATNDTYISEKVIANNPNLSIRDETYKGATAEKFVIHKFRSTIDNLGLLNVKSKDKFIPDIYLHADIDSRREILNALMDCDGSVGTRRRARYHSYSKCLAEGVAMLVRSLGGIARIDTSDRSDAIEYSVVVWMKDNPFSLPRKAEKYQPKPWFKAIESIEPYGEHEMRCITVEAENGLYCASDYTLTHNSSVIKAIAYHFGINVYYLNLNDIVKDSSLQSLLSTVRPYSILLLEDVDSYDAALSRDDEDENEDKKAEPSKYGGSKTSALLNALDGIHTPHGIIIVMTTNHPEKLDPAIMRPGRVDKTIEFHLSTLDQITAMWQLVSDKDLPEEYLTFVGKSPASFSEVMLMHAKNPDYEGTIELSENL